MLDRIVQKKYQAIAQAKERRPLNAFLPEITPGSHAFRRALAQTGWALIAECKLASPVKGKLGPGLSVAELARIYAGNGATCLSVLTDGHFCGTLSDIAAAKAVCSLPVLRKDFILDPYQVYEARAAGADAVLLIAAILTDEVFSQCLATARDLGMDCLVEVHTRSELDRVQQTPAEIIGINNRNLQTFTIDLDTTFALLPHCRGDRLVVSESGIRTGEDARRLQRAGVHGVLVGEGLVTAPDIAAKTRELAFHAPVRQRDMFPAEF